MNLVAFACNALQSATLADLKLCPRKKQKN